MSNLTNALRTYLLADATLAGQVGTRIYPDVLPQTAPLPAVLYGVVSTVVVDHLTGFSNLEQARIQYDCFAAARIAADALARVLQSRFEAYTRGVYGSVWISGIQVPSGQRHGREGPADGLDEWRYWTSVDVLVAYRNS